MKDKEFYYKVGVMCGENLYTTFKHKGFKELSERLTGIKEKYGWDMGYCKFVVQAYKDNSYDFQKSCFLQEVFSVNSWREEVEKWLKDKIKKDFKEQL